MHVIRLRGPWRYRPLARTVRLADGSSRPEEGTMPPAGRATLPDDWGATLGDDFRGRVEFRRQFNMPTGLSAIDKVFLVVEKIDAFGSLSLNGSTPLSIPPRASETRIQISELLKPTNELVVEVELPRLTDDSQPLPRPPERQSQAGGLIGEVRLELP